MPPDDPLVKNFVQKVEGEIENALNPENQSTALKALFEDVHTAWSMYKDHKISKDQIQEFEKELNHDPNLNKVLPGLQLVGFGGTDGKGENAGKKDYVLIEQKEANGAPSTFKIDSEGHIHKVIPRTEEQKKNNDYTINADNNVYHFDEKTKRYLSGAAVADASAAAPTGAVPDAAPPPDAAAPTAGDRHQRGSGGQPGSRSDIGGKADTGDQSGTDQQLDPHNPYMYLPPKRDT